MLGIKAQKIAETEPKDLVVSETDAVSEMKKQAKNQFADSFTSNDNDNMNAQFKAGESEDVKLEADQDEENLLAQLTKKLESADGLDDENSGMNNSNSDDESDLITKEMKEAEKAAHDDNVKQAEEEMQKYLKTAPTGKKQSARMDRLDDLLQKAEYFSNALAEIMQQPVPEQLSDSKNDSAVDHEGETMLRSGKKKAVEAPEPKKRSGRGRAKKRKSHEHGDLGEALEEGKKRRKLDAESAALAGTAPSSSTLGPSTVAPRCFVGQLRDYQLEGVNWLDNLCLNGLNGILADEMGLGKTIQTIAFVCRLYEGGFWGNNLIVAPLSTINNWMDEFAKFAPTLPVVLYHGSQKDRADLRKAIGKKQRVKDTRPVIITSYEIVINDAQFLRAWQYELIVVDEGHRLKNMNCKLVAELKTLTSKQRVILTGTPLQNNLTELWSLLNFLLPDMFDDLELFQRWFDFSDENNKLDNKKVLDGQRSQNIVSKLHSILKPFMLRRLKTEVIKDLPRKRELLLYAPLTAYQKPYYDACLSRTLPQFLIETAIAKIKGRTKQKLVDMGQEVEEVESENVEDMENDENSDMEDDLSDRRRSRRNVDKRSYKELSDAAFNRGIENGKIQMLENFVTKAAKKKDTMRAQTATSINNLHLNNMAMQLRKVCNHPYLFDSNLFIDHETTEEIVQASGKMMLLSQLLPALFQRGHKVLIFSQMTKILDILEDWISQLTEWKYCRLDGSVKHADRKESIKLFNSDPEYKIFLLSTRAGGLGINLTSADTVIIFDSDWNPQMDLQAQDRVHRIGQTRPVMVYRLVTANTVEQKMIERATSKRRLEKLIIQKGQFKGHSRKEADELTIAELAEVLASHDGEKVDVLKEGEQVIPADELERILDRGDLDGQVEPEEKEVSGEGEAGMRFKVLSDEQAGTEFMKQ
ncbi:P-loop containing nucleoside triphosphate hydrolase protein [Paraphysoderma sedebokerense]|nr:P-loop containing nucleoside triphosphate hydrolase protein [Paraphysoderma sedebokerense]